MPLKAVIEEFLQTFRLRDKLCEQKVMDAWRGVAGEMIYRHTVNLSVKKKVLRVRIDSAPLRHELMFSRRQLVERLNAATGAEVIADIVFI